MVLGSRGRPSTGDVLCEGTCVVGSRAHEKRKHLRRDICIEFCALQADRQNLLQFATACTNVPVGGFAKLQSAHGVYHPFTIAELTGRSGSNVLPRAAACFNTLYLPLYATKEELASQLKIAIGMGKGMIDENALVVGTRAQDSADAGSSHGG